MAMLKASSPMIDCASLNSAMAVSLILVWCRTYLLNTTLSSAPMITIFAVVEPTSKPTLYLTNCFICIYVSE